MPELKDKQGFVKDDAAVQTDRDKNDSLIEALRTDYHDDAIVKIERLEIGSQAGWRITYRA